MRNSWLGYLEWMSRKKCHNWTSPGSVDEEGSPVSRNEDGACLREVEAQKAPEQSWIARAYAADDLNRQKS